jgi:hypothetical protein
VDFAGKAVAVPHDDANLELLVPLLLPRIVGIEPRLRELEARLVGRDRHANAAVGLTRKLDVYGEPPRIPVHPDIASGEVGEARAAAAFRPFPRQNVGSLLRDLGLVDRRRRRRYEVRLDRGEELGVALLERFLELGNPPFVFLERRRRYPRQR